MKREFFRRKDFRGCEYADGKNPVMRKKLTIPESEGLTKVAESSKKGKGVKGGNQGIGM